MKTLDVDVVHRAGRPQLIWNICDLWFSSFQIDSCIFPTMTISPQLTEVVLGILGLFEVHEVPAVLPQEAVEHREDGEEGHEHNAGHQNRVQEIWKYFF